VMFTIDDLTLMKPRKGASGYADADGERPR
jgi:hypothetical protein